MMMGESRVEYSTVLVWEKVLYKKQGWRPSSSRGETCAAAHVRVGKYCTLLYVLYVPA